MEYEGLGATLESIMANTAAKIADPERQAEYARREKEQIDRDRADLLERAEIPKKYRAESFATFRTSPENSGALAECLQYVSDWPSHRDTGRGMALFGDVGVGKTHLAIAVLKELAFRYGVPCRYANVLHTFERAKWSFDSDGVNPIPLLLKCPFLVLDDLGSERPSLWTLSQVMLIVDYRLGEEKPTFVTSNAADWRGLMDMLTLEIKGDRESRAHLEIPLNRALDRLREMVGKPIIIRGKSQRGRTPPPAE